jgi:hypothetical protein
MTLATAYRNKIDALWLDITPQAINQLLKSRNLQ